MGDFLIRACKQETRSKLSSAGSGDEIRGKDAK